MKTDKEVIEEYHNPKRCKLALIRAQEVLSLLNLHLNKDDDLFFFLPHVEDLPKGAVVTHVHYDFSRDGFVLRVCHPSFPSVPEGEVIPWLKKISQGRRPVIQMSRVQWLPCEEVKEDHATPDHP